MSQLQKALKAADEDRASEQALREAAEDELTRCRGALEDEIAELESELHRERVQSQSHDSVCVISSLSMVLNN